MNNKGFYNENKEWKEKIKSFFRESGFYIMIVLGLCILAVGAVYFTTNHLITSPGEYEGELVPEGMQAEENDNKEIVILDDETEPVEEARGVEPEIWNDESNEPGDLTGQKNSDDWIIAKQSDDPMDAELPDKEESVTEVETIAKATAAPTKIPDKESIITKAPPKPDEKVEADPSQEVIKLFGGKPDFQMPVEGKIQMDYAMDRLLYSKTLDEWRTHSGIDIAAPRGEVVKAAADGFVKEIKTDPCYGITITIEHENDYKTIYSNLASGSMVSTNQKVQAGDAISSVGNTAIFECIDPPHLHFEVYKDDKLIDPKTVLPDIQK